MQRTGISALPSRGIRPGALGYGFRDAHAIAQRGWVRRGPSSSLASVHADGPRRVNRAVESLRRFRFHTLNCVLPRVSRSTIIA